MQLLPHPARAITHGPVMPHDNAGIALVIHRAERLQPVGGVRRLLLRGTLFCQAVLYLFFGQHPSRRHPRRGLLQLRLLRRRL